MPEGAETAIRVALWVLAPGGLGYVAYHAFRRSHAFYHRWEGLPERIKTIAEEIVPNGGRSLRDAVDRIEARLWWVDARAKALTEDSELGVAETDADGEWTWVNRTYLRLVGVSAEDTRRWGWLTQVHPTDRHRVEQGWKHAVDRQIEYAESFRVESPDGSDPTPIRMRAYPMRGGHDRVTGWVCVLEPQERRRLEKFVHG